MDEQIELVVFIISTEKTEYQKLAKKMWKMYMNIHPKIKCFFIENDTTILNNYIYIPEENVLKFKEQESLIPGIFLKTIYSFNWFLTNSSFKNVKFVIRTNLSSIWNFDNLFNILPSTFTKNYVLARNINNFPSGSGMVLSKDIIERFCIGKYSLNMLLNIEDDVLIGKILGSMNITNYNNGWYHHVFEPSSGVLNIDTLNPIYPSTNCYHIRCKMGHDWQGITDKLRVEKEIPAMKNIINDIYFCFSIESKYFGKQIDIIGDFIDTDINMISQKMTVSKFKTVDMYLNNCDNTSRKLIVINCTKDSCINETEFDKLLSHCNDIKIECKILSDSKILLNSKYIDKFKVFYKNFMISNVNKYLKQNEKINLTLYPI